jgi:acyl carrier protein
LTVLPTDVTQGLAPVSGERAQAAQNAPAVGGLSVEVLSSALLAIVSEKTGYPVETLELEMDMEADLGIDSIKRVEILGALQTQFPELPKVDAAALAELRTLGQITSFMSGAGIAGAAPSVEGTGASPFEGSGEELVPFGFGIEQGVVVRKILPAPDTLDFILPDGHVCLISDDGTPVTPALAQALMDKGWPVVVLRFPVEIVPGRQPLPEGAMNVDVAELSETALQAGLAQVASQYGPVAIFIHLTQAGQSAEQISRDTNGLGFMEADKSLVKMVFLAAKHLKPALNEAAEKGRAAFMTVTRLDGEFGLSELADFTPINGGLFGLVKTLNLEWDAVFCRAVDLSPDLDTERVVACILAELEDPNRLVTEVGYTQNERSTLIVASVPVTAGGKK